MRCKEPQAVDLTLGINIASKETISLRVELDSTRQ
jgi:hypothetical protein